MKAVVLSSMLAAASLLAPLRASAHITLETRQAAIGSYYKAVLRVPHGCKGSPTLKIRVRIPDGVIGVKPQPKAGWTLSLMKGVYDKAYKTGHGATAASGVREIDWSGNLPDAYYDEFVFRAYLTPELKAGDKLYFPVVQQCAKGVERWIDTPATGGASPAPSLTLLPGKSE